MIGARRFLERTWRLQEKVGKVAPEQVEKLLHRTIKKVGEDINSFKFNTAISTMMIFVNAAEKDGLSKSQYKTFLQILAPFAPHMTEDIWQSLGNPTSPRFRRAGKKSIHISAWPSFEKKYLEDDMVTFVVQVNGKVRGQLQMLANATEADVQTAAEPIIKEWLKQRVIKVVFVPNVSSILSLHNKVSYGLMPVVTLSGGSNEGVASGNARDISIPTFLHDRPIHGRSRHKRLGMHQQGTVMRERVASPTKARIDIVDRVLLIVLIAYEL